MTPSYVSRQSIGERIAMIDELLRRIRGLPLLNEKAFFGDYRNVYTAESALRRALEALADAGRHILAKGFADATQEYKAIARRLGEYGVLDSAIAKQFEQMMGYRNRLVHFYDEVTPEEIYLICRNDLDDIERVEQAYIAWLQANPDRVRD